MFRGLYSVSVFLALSLSLAPTDCSLASQPCGSDLDHRVCECVWCSQWPARVALTGFRPYRSTTLVTSYRSTTVYTVAVFQQHVLPADDLTLSHTMILTFSRISHRSEAAALLTRAGEIFRRVLEVDGWSSR